MEKKSVRPSNGRTILKLKTEINAIKEEIREDVSGPVVASFGFIIALVWRDAIRSIIDEVLTNAGLLDKMWIYDVVSAIIVTAFVILIMIMVTKFSQKKKRKKIERKIKEKMENFRE